MLGFDDMGVRVNDRKMVWHAHSSLLWCFGLRVPSFVLQLGSGLIRNRNIEPPQWDWRALSWPDKAVAQSRYAEVLLFRLFSETPVTKKLDLENVFIFLRAFKPEVAQSYKFLQSRVRYG